MTKLLESVVTDAEEALDEQLRAFLARKEGGYNALRVSLVLLSQDMPRGLFMLFCRIGAVGVPLKREFDAWRQKSGTGCLSQREAWKKYAEELARKEAIGNLEAYLLPEGCELPPDRMQRHLRLRREKLNAWDRDDLLQAHFGDEHLLPALKEITCGGCHRTSCPHHNRYVPTPPVEQPTSRRRLELVYSA